mmetsp:Transcript_12712/g.30917  ORF Transcript_12712/g.30917 Transcript_12712/m.30917 type:complete len:217 (+) Transcript_12712:153-803(+)
MTSTSFTPSARIRLVSASITPGRSITTYLPLELLLHETSTSLRPGTSVLFCITCRNFFSNPTPSPAFPYVTVSHTLIAAVAGSGQTSPSVVPRQWSLFVLVLLMQVVPSPPVREIVATLTRKPSSRAGLSFDSGRLASVFCQIVVWSPSQGTKATPVSPFWPLVMSCVNKSRRRRARFTSNATFTRVTTFSDPRSICSQGHFWPTDISAVRPSDLT